MGPSDSVSPTDIRLDWEAFYQAPNDKKLVDFVVKCGDPFPTLDPQGNEIVPRLPGKSIVLPTGVGTDYVFLIL